MDLGSASASDPMPGFPFSAVKVVIMGSKKKMERWREGNRCYVMRGL